MPQNAEYDVLIVDEAGQASEPEVACALCQLEDHGRYIQVGDHMQLPPVCMSTEARNEGLGVSQFQRLIAQPGVQRHMLVVQYRMHPSIAKWPNEEFYGGQLENGTARDEPLSTWPFAAARSSRAVCVHVNGEEREDGTSYKNLVEIRYIVHLLEALHARGGLQGRGVAVLTMYEAQRVAMKNAWIGKEPGWGRHTSRRTPHGVCRRASTLEMWMAFVIRALPKLPLGACSTGSAHVGLHGLSSTGSGDEERVHGQGAGLEVEKARSNEHRALRHLAAHCASALSAQAGTCRQWWSDAQRKYRLPPARWALRGSVRDAHQTTRPHLLPP